MLARELEPPGPSGAREARGGDVPAIDPRVAASGVGRQIAEPTDVPRAGVGGADRKIRVAVGEARFDPEVGKARGALLGLRWVDINREAGLFHIRQIVGRIRVHTQTSFYRDSLLRLKRAQSPHGRVDDLRHAFATTILDLGEHPRTVQTMLGPSSIEITLDTYSHVSLDLEKQAAARLIRLSAALRDAIK